MKKIAAVFVGAVALLVLTAAPAAAQIQVSGGFTLQDWNGWSKGFGADVAVGIHKAEKTTISVVGDFAQNRFTDPDQKETDTSLLVGGRFSFLTKSKVSPFVQVTVGKMRWNENSTFFEGSGWDNIFAAGGGVVYRVNDMFGVKYQLDILIDPTEGDFITRHFIAAVFDLGKSK